VTETFLKGAKMIRKKSLFLLSKYMIVLFSLLVNISCCRKEAEVEKAKTVDECLAKQGVLKFDESVPQRYHVTSTLYNRDLDGSVVSSMQIKADFSRYVTNREVFCKWSDVRMFSTSDLSGDFPDGKPLDYMEGFTYTLSDAILKEEFYRDFPTEDRNFMKTLIWDAPWIEVAYVAMENIEYNKPYFSDDLEEKEVEAQNFALLKTKNLKLSWTGIAKKNGEECALMEFKALSNPVKSETDILSVKGRTCSWGSFWVSLGDHEIEHAVINEDVIMEMSLSGNPLGQILNMQREVVFNKMR
jgi:hypothetical protein